MLCFIFWQMLLSSLWSCLTFNSLYFYFAYVCVVSCVHIDMWASFEATGQPGVIPQALLTFGFWDSQWPRTSVDGLPMSSGNPLGSAFLALELQALATMPSFYLSVCFYTPTAVSLLPSSAPPTPTPSPTTFILPFLFREEQASDGFYPGSGDQIQGMHLPTDLAQ